MWGVTRRFCTHRARTDLAGLVVSVATTSTGFASFALFRKQNDLFQPPRSNGRRLAYQTGTAARIIGSEDRAMCLRPLPDRATTTAPCQALTKICAFALLMLESDPSHEMLFQIVGRGAIAVKSHQPAAGPSVLALRGRGCFVNVIS